MEYKPPKRSFSYNIRKYWALYALLLPGIIWFIVFKIMPLYGIVIAFQDYKPWIGVWESPFVGLKHFEKFISGADFSYVLFNVIFLNSLKILIGLPAPVILALALSNIQSRRLRKGMQTITFFPQFFSWVVIYGILYSAFNYNYGSINNLLAAVGLERIALLAEPQYAVAVFVGSYVWKYIGWNSIIYLATISNIDPTYYEAAAIDGATRWHRLRYITLPFLIPVIIVIFLIQLGSMLYGDFEHNIVLMGRNPLYYKAIDMFESYVFRNVWVSGNAYSFGTAVGLFQAVFGSILVILSNFFIRKTGHQGLW